MIEGGWTGTMNLTEPQAGSDLASFAPRRSAKETLPRFGQKSFITYGEHDLRRTSIHLVLGRVEGAPEGVRASRCSSCEVPGERRRLAGAKERVQCASIEHKLGIPREPDRRAVYEKRSRLPGREDTTAWSTCSS